MVLTSNSYIISTIELKDLEYVPRCFMGVPIWHLPKLKEPKVKSTAVLKNIHSLRMCAEYTDHTTKELIIGVHELYGCWPMTPFSLRNLRQLGH